MPQEENLLPADRLVELLDHLGVGTAHFGTPIPRDISDMVTQYPERLAVIVLCCRAVSIRRPLPMGRS